MAFSGISMAMISMPTENIPPPKPINAVPKRNNQAESMGEASSTQANPGRPIKSPMAETLHASRPLPMSLAAKAKAMREPAADNAVRVLVKLTFKCNTSPPKGSKMMSCMLKAQEPIPTDHKNRFMLGSKMSCCQFLENPPSSRAPRLVWRASCFQRAAKFMAPTNKALPCTTWTNFVEVKSFKIQPSSALPMIKPTSMALWSKATTRGRL